MCMLHCKMLVLFLIAVILPDCSKAENICVPRNYGNDGTVCVCNSTFCDFIPRPEKLLNTQYHLYTSSKSGLRFHQTRGDFEIVSDSTVGDILIDGTTKYQPITGWGGAFTDAAGINLKTMSAKIQDSIMNSYFSENGIEYNIGRVPMGGSDFSNKAYTYDDGEEDPMLDNFNITFWDFDYKKAIELTNGSLKLFASPWTAPKWMKTNNEYTGLGFIRRDHYQTWANYYVKFLDEYQKENISFWGITTGNEPADAFIPFEKLEVVGWPPQQMADWISNYLGPSIRSSNHSGIAIMLLDDQRVYLPFYARIVFNSKEAYDYTDGIAVHWYLDKVISPNVLSETHFLFPNKFILASEACIVSYGSSEAVLLGSWSRGEEYSYDIIKDMQNWVTGWVDWNLVLNLRGGPNYINNFVDAPIIINAFKGEFYKQPVFYHMGHFSKFVSKDSVRIYSTVSPWPKLDVVAFLRTDGAKVVVLLNRNERKAPVRVTDKTGKSTFLHLDEHSISTMLYW